VLLNNIPTIYREMLVGGKGKHNYRDNCGGEREHNIIKSYRCASSVEPSPTYRVALNFDFAASKSNCSSV